MGEDTFSTYAREVKDELGYDDSDRALKNPMGARMLIGKLYAVNKKVPILEEIVDRITSLAEAKPS